MSNSFDTSERGSLVYRPELYTTGENISWRKIPDVLFELTARFKCSPTEQLVALHLARITAKTGHYPTFAAKRTQLALETSLSERAVTNAIRTLTLLKLISAQYRNGAKTLYTWNEEILRVGELRSVVPVNDVQSYQGTMFSGTSERGSRFYIDLSLELLYNSLEEFFAPHQPPYRFYVPGKRRKSSEKMDAPQGSGTTISVSRRDAWRDAAYYVYDKIKLNYDDALARVYLALRCATVEDVKFPKAALLYRVTSEESMHEARKFSHIKDHTYHDHDFKIAMDQWGTTN